MFYNLLGMCNINDTPRVLRNILLASTNILRLT